MEKKLEMLDCTLRDGCYITGSKFGAAAIRGIIEKLQEADIELIECGWLKDQAHEEDSAFFHIPQDADEYILHKDRSKTYVVMIDWDRYDVSALPAYDGCMVNAVRVVFPHGKLEGAIEIGQKIKEKGYQLYYQCANTLAYSEEELKAVAARMNELKPAGVSVVDTFGAMYEEDLERIVTTMDGALDPEIRLGFHSHNNQQLSFALCMRFVKLLKDRRDIIVDASLNGMGRGAGNATTELVVSYLNRKEGKHYNLDAIMDAIDTYMTYFKENYEWGYSTPYFIAGLYCTHVNNIAYLLNNHRTGAKDMRLIIESLDPADRLKYDYDLLESKYVANQSRQVDDMEAVAKLVKKLDGRKLFLIAPGLSSLEKKDEILKKAEEENAMLIGVNAILPGYAYDEIFFVNPGRYDYARKASPETFSDVEKIVLSNIKQEAEGNELIVNYASAIKRGYPHFDNAVISLLRLLDKLGVSEVSLAGFDGFRNRYNESYADPFLPTLNPDNHWDELNEEIRAMFLDFKDNAKNLNKVNFLTESYFEV